MFKDITLTSTHYRANNLLQLWICAQFGCFLGSSFSVVVLLILFSWKSVFTTSHCITLCEISSVHEILSNFNNIQKFCIHIEFTYFCCDRFSIRSPYCCNKKVLYVGSLLSKRTSVLITPRSSEELECPIINGSSSSRERIHILHTCSRPLRRNWADFQKQLFEKRSQSIPDRLYDVSIVCHVFCFRNDLWSNGIEARKSGHPLSANSNNIFSAMWSKIPCGLFPLIECQFHFFRKPRPMSDDCLFQIFLHTKIRIEHLSDIPLHCFLVWQELYWTST